MTPHQMKVVALAAVALVLLLVALPLVAGYEGRREIVKSNRDSCARVVKDRLSTIKVRMAQAEGAQAISTDTFQSTVTRNARRHEAKVLWHSVRDETTRVDPANYQRLRKQLTELAPNLKPLPTKGGLDCARAFPAPSVLP
jgi:hypothetical protein